MWTVILLIPLILILLHHGHSLLPRILYHRSFHKIHVARNIVNFRQFNVRTLGERLLIRALPNRRLVAAFGIKNAFTTTDPLVYKRFARYATSLINRVNADNEEWRQLLLLGQDTLQRYMSSGPEHQLGTQEQRLHLTSTVRILCFVVVLHFLFPGVESVDLEAARSATDDINRLWMQSKDASVPVSEREQDLLVTKIRQMLPINGQLYDLSGLEEQSNPLNIILPAFETLWRVVLLTYVHIAFRGSPAALPANQANPPGRLPLYQDEYAACFKVIAADIESLHRDPSIWGHNAHDFFLPRMAQGLTQEQKDAYMPFGLAPHLCPAANKFGERMISMLLGLLLHGLGSSGTGATIEYGDAKLDGDLHAPLPTGREDAEGWYITL
ncbi:hypothetical protein PG985_004384 [Apiospora marii]|uniref:Cytochrome P450 n=1 Tax=Apiospora marii TaxID=335849 RepID=A0ABR1S956_9PEZI